MLAPGYLERVAGALDAHPEGNCAFTDFELFGAEVGFWRYKVRDVTALFDEQWLPGPGTLLRRSLWERVGGYCEAEPLRKGNEDWDFWLSAAERGFYALHIPEPLYRYRRHADSMSIWQKSYEHITRLFMYRRHKAFFDSHLAGSRFQARAYYASAGAARGGGRLLRAHLLTARGFMHRVFGRDSFRGAYLTLFRVLALSRRKPPAPQRLCGVTLGAESHDDSRGLPEPQCPGAGAQAQRPLI
jgi:hypothetical protein